VSKSINSPTYGKSGRIAKFLSHKKVNSFKLIHF